MVIQPLSSILKQHLTNSFLSIHVPPNLSDLKLEPPPCLAQNLSTSVLEIIPDIPSWFWFSSPILFLPQNKHSRRAVCYDRLDLIHPHLCNTKKFHTSISESCVCSFCFAPTVHFHHKSCQFLCDLSSSELLNFLL